MLELSDQDSEVAIKFKDINENMIAMNEQRGLSRKTEAIKIPK